MTDRMIIKIMDTTSFTLYECDSGALRTLITTTTTARPVTVRHDDYEITTRRYPGSTGSVFVGREVAAE